MTFLLNSTSNLSSDGWKLPAEGINESCMKERAGKRWGGEAGGRKARWGLCLFAEVSRESGGALQSTQASAARLGAEGPCVCSVCASGTAG